MKNIVEKIVKLLIKTSYDIDETLAVPYVYNKYKDPFKTLISVVLSIRSREEITIKASDILFERYLDINSLADANQKDIENLLSFLGLYKNKSRWIIEIAKKWMEYCSNNKKEPNCKICDEEFLLSLPGVGRKVMNVYLSLVCGRNVIAVDTHVHRIFNRIGIVSTKTPEQTEIELYKIIPKKYWREINESLVKFGRNVCTPINPKCDVCPIKTYCKYYKEKAKK